MASSAKVRCSICSSPGFLVNGYPVCGTHARIYKASCSRCHLTEFHDKARRRFNEKIFRRCDQLGLVEVWGKEHLQLCLQKHSHEFNGEEEIRRRKQHVDWFFGGQFDSRRKHQCEEILKAQMFPVELTSDHLVDIALACLAAESNENGNGQAA